MTPRRKTSIFVLCLSLAAALIILLPRPAADSAPTAPDCAAIADSVSRIAAEYPAEIGVALIVDGVDTITVNNRPVYPLMSVFKVHQAIALCRVFDQKGLSLDSLLTIRRDRLDRLDPDTWRPMLSDHTETEFSLTVSDLLRYALTVSDNNASNLMFSRLVGVAETDSIIASIIPRSSFRIAYSEEAMSADHSRAYANLTSPLGAAILFERLFTDSLISSDKQQFIIDALYDCRTGLDRISAPLLDKEGLTIAHKTGSGYIDPDGVLVAHNDLAFITLPDNRHYTLAIFIKDFHTTSAQPTSAQSTTFQSAVSPSTTANTQPSTANTQPSTASTHPSLANTQASLAISRISAAVYSLLSSQK